MAGRQIRWGSVGRVAGIVIAALAGIASLPALLGSDAPPPVPADVGLTPPPPSTSASPAPAKPPPSEPRPPVKRHRPRKHRLARRPTEERNRRRHRPNGKQGDETAAPPAEGDEKAAQPAEGDETAAPPAPQAGAVPAPAYSYAPPSNSGEFRIER